MKRLFFPLLFLLCILFVSPVIADAQNYLTPGVGLDSKFLQDGTGIWANRAPTQYIRTYTNIHSYVPVVGNIDNDTTQEIVILADDNLVILNSTFGIGLLTEQTLSHGTTAIAGTTFRVTPALFDMDSSGANEIVSFNTTHMLVYSYNGTTIVLNQSATTGLNTTATTNPSFQTPVIKCAQGTQFSSGNDTCIMPITNRDGVAGDPTFLVYDVTSNTVYSVQAAASANQDTTFRNTHLVDGDADGFLEGYFSRRDPGNGDLHIYKLEISATPTITELYEHQLPPNTPFTDIIVSDLYSDLGTLDITYGYTDDGTDYQATTIRASDGAILQGSYCFTTCPEGDGLSANMFQADDTTYSDFSNDVCYHIRNYEESSIITGQTANQDAVFCVSQFAGSGWKNTFIDNNQNFSINPMIHQADLHNRTSLLLPRFTIDGLTKQSFPVIPDHPAVIPVDAQRSGSLDMLSMNTTALVYLDDAYTNNNVEITNIDVNTGNPVCQNELIDLAVSYDDVENDDATCYIQETWGNDTVITNLSSQTKNSPGTITFTHLADTVGTFKMTYYCKDQYHTNYDTYVYPLRVSNDTTTCNLRGSDPFSQAQQTTTQVSLDQNFESDVEGLVCGAIGMCSQKARVVFWLIIMGIVIGGVIVAAAKHNIDGMAMTGGVAFIGIVMLIIGWVIGFLTAVPLVLLGLFMSLVLSIVWVSNRGG